MRELLRGARLLGAGFGYWRVRPAPMWLGLVPAAIAAALIVGVFVALGFALPTVTEAITPFASGWPTPWRDVARLTAGVAVVAASLVLVALTFTALTLFIGEPFYARIWAAVEQDAGGRPPEVRYGLWRALGDGISLILRGVAVAVASALLGLVPIVGGLLAGLVAVVLTGWVLADELTSRALTARGVRRGDRQKLLRGHRMRVLGFGAVTQLCFLVPGGAILTMPAAVAGSTLLARSLLPTGSTGAAGRGHDEAGAGQ